MFYIKKAIYVLKLTNSGESAEEIKLILNDRDFNMFLANSEMVSPLDSKNSIFYELLVPNRGRIMIESFNCLGKINFYASKNYEFLKNGAYELKEKSIKTANHKVSIFEVERGILFIGVSAYKNHNDRAFFKFKFYL